MLSSGVCLEPHLRHAMPLHCADFPIHSYHDTSGCNRLQESRAELLQAFRDHPWVNMLHLHVGSQGLNLDTVIAGVSCILQQSLSFLLRRSLCSSTLYLGSAFAAVCSIATCGAVGFSVHGMPPTSIACAAPILAAHHGWRSACSQVPSQLHWCCAPCLIPQPIDKRRRCCAAGIQAVWELCQEIEQQCGGGRIRMLDIGGGLSVNYSTDDAPQVGLA